MFTQGDYNYQRAAQPAQPFSPQPFSPYPRPVPPHPSPVPPPPRPHPIPPPHPSPVPPPRPHPIPPHPTPPPFVPPQQPPVLRPPTPFTDYGPAPFVVNIEEATLANDFYRQTLWTGHYLQATLMCIPPGCDIGLEVHPDTDQFLRLEEGQGIVLMGDSKNHMPHKQTVFKDSAVFVPAGTWHNISNIGTVPMKLYSIYAPPHHPRNTVHTTKEMAEKMGA